MKARDILTLARKWFWLIILACLIGGAAGLVVTFLQPKVYEASTTLYLVSPNRSDYTTVLGDQQAAAALALIPQSDPVLVATLQAVGDQSLTPSQLSSMITVTNNRDTQFVVIRVRDSDPSRAARLAAELAKQSVARFQAAATDSSQSKQFVKQELDRLTIDINNLEKELADLQNQTEPSIPSASQMAQINQLNTNLAAERTLYNQLLTSYMSMSGTQVTILPEAGIPNNPIAPKLAPAIAIGMLVGLIAILGVIVLIEQTDDTLRTPAKVSEATGLSTLITVEHLPAGARRVPLLNGHREVIEEVETLKLMALEQTPTAVTAHKAKDKALSGFQLSEAFLTLGMLLSGGNGQFTSNGSSIGSLLVTSPEDGDGKTLTASQIALGLARIGVEVVLVDANLRHPGVHSLFSLSNVVGLSSLLNGRTTGDPNSQSQAADYTLTVLQKTHEPNLAILPSGPTIGSPAEALSSPRMAAILKQLSKKAFVVIDSPAVLTSSEPVILADKCDGILMVVDARHTATVKLNRSLELLTWVNANILGVVLNQVVSQN